MVTRETKDTTFTAQIRAAIARITDPAISLATVDINNCDREPIHTPSAIQPHGVLLVLSGDPWMIVQVSQNTDIHLGYAATDLVGQPATAVLSDRQIEQIKQCLDGEFEVINPLNLILRVEDDDRKFTGIVHANEEEIVLELEPTQDINNPVDFFDFYRLVKQPLDRIQHAASLDELCQVAVREVKRITGFDRVMVYRFAADGSGSVIAEAKQTHLPPYLGLHYPATDVPKQAKYLYTLNLLRLIPDVTYKPVPLVPSQRPEGKVLDMSVSTLRSVSPLHTEYLMNMGVSASMSISLVRDRQLWGLIACHHNTPRQLSYELRTICEFLGQTIGLELASKVDNEDADYKIRLAALQREFATALTKGQTLKDGLTQDAEHLLALTGATGAAYCESGNITLLGHTPDADQTAQLTEWVSHQIDNEVLYQTNDLSRKYPEAETLSPLASGLLALIISRVHNIYLLWFRPEIPQTINWAGNPRKPIQNDEAGQLRMSPRQSFDLWKEQVRLKSLPWKPCEQEAALELRSSIIGIVLKQADELAQVNSELERSNIELDSFAYIASHDLKEPLRGIHNYSSFLIEDYGGQLGEDGTSKLQTLMTLTRRMENLINSLLHYSRLGRAELRITPVDLDQLVDDVIDVIRITKPESTTFNIPCTLPTVGCDRTQITELYTNLITNAIKYNDRSDKRVEIGYLSLEEAMDQGILDNAAMPWPTSTIFYVRDNGIGIRSKHLEAVFRIFKRLHPPGRYSGGTGAGLTIARKIVERHRGQIWVDSVYGEGSTFYFTLDGPVDG